MGMAELKALQITGGNMRSSRIAGYRQQLGQEGGSERFVGSGQGKLSPEFVNPRTKELINYFLIWLVVPVGLHSPIT